MKNIIICGLIGTGKTTIAKEIEKKLGLKYIDLYDIINSKFDDKNYASEYYSKDIDNYLLTLEKDKYVIDVDYLILPNQFNKYKSKENFNIIYLGFNDIDIDLLYKKFSNDFINKNKKFDEIELMNELKYFIQISKKVYSDCEQYNYPFFSINKDKKILIQEIYNYILNTYK